MKSPITNAARAVAPSRRGCSGAALSPDPAPPHPLPGHGPHPHPLLVEDATDCLLFERLGGFSHRAARLATRDMLADRARELGVAERKIERAIDAALRAASLNARGR